MNHYESWWLSKQPFNLAEFASEYEKREKIQKERMRIKF